MRSMEYTPCTQKWLQKWGGGASFEGNYAVDLFLIRLGTNFSSQNEGCMPLMCGCVLCAGFRNRASKVYTNSTHFVPSQTDAWNMCLHLWLVCPGAWVVGDLWWFSRWRDTPLKYDKGNGCQESLEMCMPQAGHTKPSVTRVCATGHGHRTHRKNSAVLQTLGTSFNFLDSCPCCPELNIFFFSKTRSFQQKGMKRMGRYLGKKWQPSSRIEKE